MPTNVTSGEMVQLLRNIHDVLTGGRLPNFVTTRNVLAEFIDALTLTDSGQIIGSVDDAYVARNGGPPPVGPC